VDMADLSILFQGTNGPTAGPARWLRRAARARRIAMMLSRTDAAVAEAYATECEAVAMRLIEQQGALIAAQ
jgi:hypothetical protein